VIEPVVVPEPVVEEPQAHFHTIAEETIVVVGNVQPEF
jgi:hypothetical protein